jgi:hypothetical protein
VDATTEASADASTDSSSEVTPGWWHRDHPVFTALSGFFTGLLLVTVVPGGWIGLLRLALPYDEAERLFPLVLAVLVLPLGGLASPRTRRFSAYVLLGAASTALVVLGVVSLVLWLVIALER